VGSNLASRTGERVGRVSRKVRYGRISNTIGRGWRRFKSWGYFKTYFGFGLTTRIILLLMFLFGVVVLFALSTTDLGIDVKFGSYDVKRPSWLQPYNEAWLHSHAYIPNILAGFTGFLIGAPVAAVILAHFTTEREERAALERVNRLSQLAWYTFRDAVHAFDPELRLDAVQNDAPIVEKAHDRAYKVVNDYIEFMGPWVDRAPEVLEDKIQAIRLAAREFDDVVRRLMLKVKDSGTIEMEWSTIVGAWNTLDQYVRLQRLERDLAWFDSRVDAKFRLWMSREKNLLQEFTDIHGSIAENYPHTMTGAAGAMNHYANCNEAELQSLLGPTHGGTFGYFRVDNYNTAHRNATSFLIDLLGAIAQVEVANWPESASKPVKTTESKI
jgi:hypothetical protein